MKYSITKLELEKLKCYKQVCDDLNRVIDHYAKEVDLILDDVENNGGYSIDLTCNYPELTAEEALDIWGVEINDR